MANTINTLLATTVVRIKEELKGEGFIPDSLSTKELQQIAIEWLLARVQVGLIEDTASEEIWENDEIVAILDK